MSKAAEKQGKEFLLNQKTGEIHHMPYRTPSCQTDEIKSFLEIDSLKEAREHSDNTCSYCFKSKE